MFWECFQDLRELGFNPDETEGRGRSMILSLVLSRSSSQPYNLSRSGAAQRSSSLRRVGVEQQPDWHRLMHSDSYLKMVTIDHFGI
jgi:hypothetical protein